MPGRNTRKIDVADSYYHVYARGSNKQKIFIDDNDFVYFLSLLKRYLSHDTTKSYRGVSYEKLHDNIQLLAYCLMRNHFHLLFYQVNDRGMSRLMHGVMTAYSMYFNKKYNRRGPLFESRYRASRVTTEPYLLHISRYIHLNPAAWQTYRYSSLSSYLTDSGPDWVIPGPIKALFNSHGEYFQFLKDYELLHQDIESIKHQLANYIE